MLVLLMNVGLDDFLCLFVRLFAASLLALFLGWRGDCIFLSRVLYTQTLLKHTLLAIRIRDGSNLR